MSIIVGVKEYDDLDHFKRVRGERKVRWYKILGLEYTGVSQDVMNSSDKLGLVEEPPAEVKGVLVSDNIGDISTESSEVKELEKDTTNEQSLLVVDELSITTIEVVPESELTEGEISSSSVAETTIADNSLTEIEDSEQLKQLKVELADELNKLYKEELVQQCIDLNLDDTGTKSDLIERLVDKKIQS